MTTTTLQRVDNTVKRPRLYMVFELSHRKWKVGFGTGGRKLRVRDITARDLKALREEIDLAKRKLGLPEDADVYSCYEAGRDGFWLDRYLGEMGVKNIVVDSSSIEVNRRKKRAKTDRVDVRKLYGMLLRYYGGEERVWSVVRVPSRQDEDERRIHREMLRLQTERTGHSNRITSLLIAQGIEMKVTRQFPGRLEGVRCGDGSALGAELKAELLREYERWQLVVKQLRELEKRTNQVTQAVSKQTREALLDVESTERLKKAPKELSKPSQVAALKMLSGIDASAWRLVYEFFWRRFRNRREVGNAAGLCGMPYTSGEKEVEQGISKAGNSHVRCLMVELAWCWMRYQPRSALAIWFNKRFGSGGKRMQRVGIVAVARRLLVSLWRYLEFGEVPLGAQFKPNVRKAA